MAVKPAEQSSAASTLAVLYEEHAAAAYRYAFHLTGRREDAEDVVQQVFLQTYRALEAGRTLMSPRAWLMKAVKHGSLNVIRGRREQPNEELVADTPAAGAPAEEARELADVRSMLWTLPESQHSAFVLRHWSGLSQHEIAEVLDTTESAVESLLIRARAALVDEAAEPQSDCRGVRDRLVRFLPLSHDHESHVGGCRRCRIARKRLARTAEIAAALSLGPRPHVAHALAAAIPGFGGGGVATAAGGGATAASAGSGSAAMAGGGTLVSSAPLAAKAGMAAKALALVLAATAAASTVHPIRQPLENLLLGRAAAQPPVRSQPVVHTASDVRSAMRDHASSSALPSASTQGPGDGTQTGRSNPGAAHGRRHGKAAGTSNAGGHGRPANPGGGASHGHAAKKTGQSIPPGQAKKSGDTSTPPGQAKKTGGGSTPPGQAKKSGGTSTPPGHARKTGSGSTPPGQSKATGGGHGAGSSNGNGASNGSGGSNAGGNGHGHA